MRRRARHEIEFRKFARRDVAAAHLLSREAGWPHRTQDWLLARSLGAGFVAVDDGELVGTLLYWRHDRRFASLGMVIVDRARRGQGIGRRLMELAMADLQGRSVLLNATAAGRPLYERFGFRTVGRVHQHQGVSGSVGPVELARGARLRPVGASDAPLLEALATRAAGVSRARVIRALLGFAEGIVLDDGCGNPVGFSLFRRFGHGYLVGPVAASDPQAARALIAHWASTHPRSFIRTDVDASAHLEGWLEGLGLKHVDTVDTMVYGDPPVRDWGVRAFALVNQALG